MKRTAMVKTWNVYRCYKCSYASWYAEADGVIKCTNCKQWLANQLDIINDQIIWQNAEEQK